MQQRLHATTLRVQIASSSITIRIGELAIKAGPTQLLHPDGGVPSGHCAYIDTELHNKTTKVKNVNKILFFMMLIGKSLKGYYHNHFGRIACEND